MELELKHLAPYLPYDLGIEPIYKSTFMGGYNQKVLDTSILFNYELEEIKPILRPLSDLTTEDVSQSLLDRIKNSSSRDLKESLSYNSVSYLLEKHFDVFGLIEEGLAININTL